MMTTKDIRNLMSEGKQIQVLTMKCRHGQTFIVDSANPKKVYGQVSRCVLQNFDTELKSTLQLYDIHTTKGLKKLPPTDC